MVWPTSDGPAETGWAEAFRSSMDSLAALCMECIRAACAAASPFSRIPLWDSDVTPEFISIAAAFWGSGSALAGGLVEQDRSGGRGVQGFDRRGHGDPDAGVGGALDLFGKALALVADEDGHRAAPVHLPRGEKGLVRAGRLVGAGGHDVDARGAELFDNRGGGVAREDGKVQGSSGGSAQGF